MGKKYLIVEIDEENIIRTILYPGEFKSISGDYDGEITYNFKNSNYINNYWNSSNLNKIKKKFNNKLTEKYYFNIENIDINFKSLKKNSDSELVFNYKN